MKKMNLAAIGLNLSKRYNSIKAELTEGHDDVHDAVVTIEGKDGQVIITLELNDKPDMK